MLSQTDLILAVAVTVLTTTVCFFGRNWNDPVRAFLQTLPAVGLVDRNWYSWKKAIFKSITKSREMVAEGYEPFNKNEKPFVLPSLGSGIVVILPPSQLKLLNKPESQVGAWEFQTEILQPRYTMGPREYVDTTMKAAFAIVWKRLPRAASRLAPLMQEELTAGFQKYWGSTEPWTTISLFDACAQIVACTTHRTFFGLPLCRDETLLKNSLNFALAVFGSASLISALPPVLRKIFAPALGLPARWYQQACKRSLAPLVKARLDQYRSGQKCPEDFLQWLIKEYETNHAECINVDHITQSLLILNMTSIYSTTYTLTNCILDLYSSPRRDEFIEGLREESQRVMIDSTMTESDLAAMTQRLYRMDSCLRESMRCSSFNVVGLLRFVSDSSGLGLDDHTIFPRGVRFGFPQQSIHFDESYYPDARNFDAFRFSQPFESESSRAPLPGLLSGGGTVTSSSDATSGMNNQQEPATSINTKFITWGFGQHACPGRLFASQLIKLAMARIVVNYDIEIVGNRIPNKPILNILMPPASTEVRVRRIALA